MLEWNKVLHALRIELQPWNIPEAGCRLLLQHLDWQKSGLISAEAINFFYDHIWDPVVNRERFLARVDAN
jgi:hypothetical protein